MKARPILFSAEMVRALLDDRKGQTRRTKGLEYFSKPENEPDRWWCARVRDGVAFFVFDKCPNEREVKCPYGKPGDLLWVRETWAQPTSLDPGPVFYHADYPNCVPRQFQNVPQSPDDVRWSPSIHMFRWMSRLTLRITNIRVERLQNISEEDARAEGVLYVLGHGDITPGELRADPGYSTYLNGRMGFEVLWTSINGAESWAANPWVWQITFKTVRANVDQVLREAA